MASHDDIDQLFRQIGGVSEGYREFAARASDPVTAVASERAEAGLLQPAQAALPSLPPADAAPVPPLAAAAPITATANVNLTAATATTAATPLASLFSRLARAGGPSPAQGAH